MRAKAFSPHARLAGEQRDASAPDKDVWLSASAGTGKTYVLSARVLRLLLRGAAPDGILCLTFTKAGAAEMAERVHERLAHWVRLDDGLLYHELQALGEDSGPHARDHARTLFAKVLEARGGGLRIMTIHAFCQTLLAGFPVEAGLVPGFRAVEGREETALAASVLAELVVTAEREGDRRLLDALSLLSRRMGEDAARKFLDKAAKAGAALNALPDGPDAIAALVRRALDVPAEYGPDTLVAACTDGAFDRAALDELARMLADWSSTRAAQRGDALGDWLMADAAGRAATLDALRRCWCKADGGLFDSKGWVPTDPGYAALVERLDAWCGALAALRDRAELATAATAALEAGRRYARAYAAAKRVRGLVDFDDLIAATAALLAQDGIGDWIRYKLDQATDHILVDEAQDTNAAQWDIVKALANDFYAGQGARAGVARSFFSVGDYKQSIFSFQGSDPEAFNDAGHWFMTQAARAQRDFALLSLDRSFRSAQPVLDIVDTLLESLGSDALGLPVPAEPHASHPGGFGAVTLLQPLTGESDAEAEGDEGWIEDHVRKLATAIAKQVRQWLDAPLRLHRKGRALYPGDIMILVRKRGALASLLVARLQEEGVEVAGVDRLRLKAPLAVKDLLAAMRFAVQRGDDLTLASLLVSPIFGWTQDDLFAVAHGRKGSLWDAIPQGATRDGLVAILNSADRVTPFAFLEHLLSGPLKARAKLVARLGAEARDPIDELLAAALAFGREQVPTLQGFLDWFDRGEGEVVRDAGGAGDAVRVLTVHGAKGLQAPLVLLADAAGDPDAAPGRDFEWLIDPLTDPVPLFRPNKAERALVAALQAAADTSDAAERREHWRLLYVAMTRAEERLVVAGSLGPKAKGVVPPTSWHAAIAAAMTSRGGVPVADPLWGSRVDYAPLAEPARGAAQPVPAARSPACGPNDRPGWLHSPAPLEARPPRPLAPSSLGHDDVAAPPAGVAAAAAERGRLLHGLFERLPPLAPDTRRAAGLRWLGARDDGDALVDTVLRVLEDPACADIFAPDALAEAPVAGVVDGVVVAGTVDRLIVRDESVTVIDFKTGSRVPPSPAACPEAHLRQMAAYVAVLEGIFPGSRVEGVLLYSAGPRVHRLDPALLAAHKPGYQAGEEHLAQPSA